jgi:hypothetical protein
MTAIRKSVPTKGVHVWWMSGWSYVMPDFSVPGNSIVEWDSDKPPVYAVEDSINRVPEASHQENADGSQSRT